MTITEEILQLEDELKDAELNYRLGLGSSLSDIEFDLKSKKLAKLYNGNIPTDSIIYKVGSDNIIKGFKKINHLCSMLSLDNTYSEQEFEEWFNKLNFKYKNAVSFFVQEKIDGCSLSCVYENGSLVRIVTRGDGKQGEDITSNLQCISGIPAVLAEKDQCKIPDIIEIRGEVYMTYAEFNRINEELEKQNEKLYANPRNLTAGTIKLLDSNESNKRKLNFIVHSIGFFEYKNNQYKICDLNHFQNLCHNWGFECVRTECATIDNNTSKIECLNKIKKLIAEFDKNRKLLKYPTDGAVIKIQDFDIQKELGYTNKVPKWAIAYKFEAEKAKTKIKSITLQVGRTGAITPVAELEPVELSGSIVKRATCHNIDEMISRDIRVGDNVFIEKSGEIIPYIIGPVKEDRTVNILPYVFNEKCPICGSKAIKIGDLKHWYCSNNQCPAIIQAQMEHFVSRDCMNIDGLSSAWIKNFIDAGLLKEFADLYHITKSDFMKLDRMGEKLASKLFNNIENSKFVEPWRFLHAIGVSGVGKTMAKEIMSYFNNDFNKLCTIASDKKLKIDEFLKIPNIAEKTAKDIVRFFNTNIGMINKLLNILTFDTTGYNSIGKWSGKIFVITGTHDVSRDELIQDIEREGGKVTGSVSKKTNYLLLGKDPGSKYDKALKLGIKIIKNLNEI